MARGGVDRPDRVRAFRIVGVGILVLAGGALVNLVPRSVTSAEAAAHAPTVPPGWVVYRDQAYRFSVQIPPGWRRPQLTTLDRQNRALLHLVSRDAPTKTAGCAEPTNNLTVSGAQVGIELSEQLGPSSASIPRAIFGPTTVGVFPSVPRARCPTADVPTTRGGVITDAGRELDFFLFSGPDATPQRQAEAYQILNSLRFDAYSSRHPRPYTKPFGPSPVGPAGGVAVLDGTATTGAASVTANLLRGLGYTIVGTGNAASPQTGTTAACRVATQAEALAKALGLSAQARPFPNPAPVPFANADCIVTIGG